MICHNDVAPYNTVFVDGRPRALIDFDTAGPGPRVWDIAYAAYTFVPLGASSPAPTVASSRMSRRSMRASAPDVCGCWEPPVGSDG